ncbi:hypothetical protein SAMN04487884_1058 [Butyrivibrio fibrisolvens]|uniref:Glycosyltransferase 2-like domain-containing protein n=1 Tax=Butyrivibrio fibrisolvens TaxID=831 RepID=A0A1H9NSV9_BUTFI|nr:glycosyltransferase family 2 protein [Butyrivibrio fibrisolvens]SER39046.1 hypothetical protein SAMN04487884_1058 [Butyrivibrio fibrisolvens]
MKSDVLAIVINYQGYEDTKKCIDYCLLSSYRMDILVIDNGSDKDVYKLRLIDNITLIENSTNIGFGSANNIGIRYAKEHKYKYCLFINNDTLADRYMLENMMHFASEDTCVVPLIFYDSNHNKVWYAGGKIDRFRGGAYHYGLRMDVNKLNLSTKECNFATGCCLLISTDTIYKMGGFPDSYFMYVEDVELSINIEKQGNKVLFVPDAKLFHKVGGSSGGELSPISVYYSMRNRLYLVEKCKDYFYITAKLYLVTMIIIKMSICFLLGDRLYKYYIMAIKDYKAGIIGFKEMGDNG